MKKLLALLVIGMMFVSGAYATAGCGSCSSEAAHEEGTDEATATAADEGTATATTEAAPAGDATAPAAPAKK